MDAWLERMKQNDGIIPSFVDLDGTIGGPDGRWWKNAYGWGFSPVNPVTGRREDRNRIPRALVGFNNALLVTGDQKYVDAWRTHDRRGQRARARRSTAARQYPTMYGADGWYGWRDAPWNVGALEVWYWSQNAPERSGATRRAATTGWVDFLDGQNPAYPGTGARARSRTRSPQRLTRDARATRHRRNGGWPTTCSTTTRPRPSRWCS